MRAFLVLEGGRLVHLANGASLPRLADEVTPYPPESRSPLWTACLGHPHAGRSGCQLPTDSWQFRFTSVLLICSDISRGLSDVCVAGSVPLRFSPEGRASF